MRFNNEFFGRDEDFSVLHAFLSSDDLFSLALVSNGGYGKTRLCIEFMRRVEREKNDWLPLVLVHHGYNTNELARLLGESGRLLILLDNANEVPDIVDDVKRQIEATKGRVKLLLTTRNTLFNQTLGRMSSHNSDVKKHELKALAPDVALKMLQTELPHIEHRNLLALRDISRGVPNVILELIGAVRNGQSINTISTNNFFATNVMNIVMEAANSIFRESGIAQGKTIDLLQVLSIISPVNNDGNNIAFIAAMMEVAEEKVETIINRLSDAELIEKTNTISIKPDPYSDVILAEACKSSMRLIKRVKDQQGAEKYVENIVKNLAEAEIPSNEKDLFTQQMLKEYFAIVSDPTTPPRRLTAALEFARNLSYSKPKSAVIVVTEWMKLLAVDASALLEHDGYTQKTLVQTANEIVACILGNVVAEAFVHDKTKLPELFELIEQFIKASGYYKVLNACFGFRHWHCKCNGYRLTECCGLQHFLKDRIVQFLSNANDPSQIRIALEAHDVLMELEFNDETYYDNFTMTLHWGWYQLPDCEHAKQFRIESVQAIIAFYKSGHATLEQKQKLLPALGKKLFQVSKSSAERYKFNTDAEMDAILSFLQDILQEQPELWEKIAVANAPKIRNKSEIRPEFELKIEAIRFLTKAAGSLKEELQLLLGSQDYFDSRKNAGNNCLRILKEYSDNEQFIEDFISINAGQKLMSTPFHECLTAFVAHAPEFSKALFERIIHNYPDQIPLYALLIRSNNQDQAYFNDTTETILSKHPEHIASVVWMLVYGKNQEVDYRFASDLDVFETAINQEDSRAIGLLESQLIYYLFVDKHRTLALYDTILPLLHKDQIAGVFHHIYSDEAVTTAFPKDLLALLHKHKKVIPLDETFGGNEVLNFIEERFGFDELYTFIRKWVEQKIASSTYGLFSFDDHRMGTKVSEEKLEAERFMFVLRKFITLNPDQFEWQLERQILKVFRPNKGFTILMQEKSMSLLEEFKTNEHALMGLAKGLSIFSPTSEPFILSMCAIADAYFALIQKTPTFHQTADFFGHDFYFNGGIKSKSGNGPYPIDVQKKELFEKVIAKNQFSTAVMIFLGRCLQRVQQDIDQEIESNRARFSWYD
ncbi:hypothetical protein GCM10023092_22820 [Rurimicrobium arvi]|uniref:Uncharacterized protein n=2 Tax=Rurimicrobium arvi TaxID=2049916 RepID=A0ABP8MY08_9BACT